MAGMVFLEESKQSSMAEKAMLLLNTYHLIRESLRDQRTDHLRL